MGSKSETGHAVNAGNFSRLVLFCVELGPKYNPPDAAISVAKLQLRDGTITSAMIDFNEKKAPWMQAVNAREAAMEPVNRFMTQVKNVVDVCDVTQQFKDDVAGLVKKIQGVRATPKIKTVPGDPTTPTDESIVQISASQQGIDNKLDNIGMLIALLKEEPKYTPNEPELSILFIETEYNNLKAKNTTVSQKAPAMEQARINRNRELYDDGAGNDLAGKVKKYYKAMFGGNSQEYHSVAKLKFTKLGK